MKLSRLLELHEKFLTPHSLLTNLGDGYLVQHNPIYKNIRSQTLGAGFKTSDGSNPFYQALPLSQLETLLTTKTIPFTDNVSVLKSIEAQIPNQVDWNDITDNLKTNQIFHESCHAVARHLFQKNISQDSKLSQHRPLQMLLEESLANSCELLGICDVHESVHRVFYEINSYTSLFEERSHLLAAKKHFGEAELLKFLILTYLCANFLYESLDEKSLIRIIEISFAQKKLDNKDLKTLRNISKICFRLDKRFRTVTTSFYLRLSGIATDFRKVLDFDFLKMIGEDPETKSYLDLLVKAALKPLVL